MSNEQPATNRDPLNLKGNKAKKEETTSTVDESRIIKLLQETSFGTPRYKPHNDTAKLVLNLVNGRKGHQRTTFDQRMIDACKALGFEVYKVPVCTEITKL